MRDIRPPDETDREAIALLSGLAFNSPARPERISLSGRLCVYDGARVAASARSIDFDQWFGGARVPCAGIEGVVVQPEDRGHGTAAALVSELLRKGRAEGRLVSALYPSTATLYRKLGYEFAGFRPHFRAAIADLPAAGLPGGNTTNAEVSELSVREMNKNEIGEVMTCFSKFARRFNGPVETADPAFWVDRSLAHAGEGTYQRTAVVEGKDGIAGYASYFLEERRGGSYVLFCKHLVATSAAAFNSLIRYFRRFENAAKDLVWLGPVSAGPLGLVLQTNGFALSPSWTRWMLRVLDVPGALEARGYPAVEGETVLRIHDPLFPGNSGPWVVRASGGRVAVAPTEPRPVVGAETRPAETVPAKPGPAKTLPIGLFSALYTGLVTPSDLVLLGALDEDDPSLGFLTALFAGPVPWMPDAF